MTRLPSRFTQPPAAQRRLATIWKGEQLTFTLKTYDRVAYKIRRLRLNATKTRRGEETLDIAKLISPLRYDVIVRAQFFEFLSAHTDRSAAELTRLAIDEPYFVWFEHIECARFFPELLAHRDDLLNRFALRVAGAVRTLRSFRENGFDRRFPVVLASVGPGAISDSGAPAIATIHIADGCHRLALLLADGRELLPWMHQIRPAARALQDNTRILVSRLSLDEATYSRFISQAFIDMPVDSLSQLRAELERTDPARVPDLEGTIAAHRPPHWPS